MNNLTNFIRIKDGIEGDNLGIDLDIIGLVKEELQRRSNLFDDVGYRFQGDGNFSYPVHAMRIVVQGEKRILETVIRDLDDLIQRVSTH